MEKQGLSVAVVLFMFSIGGRAAMEVTAPDGKAVRLNDDHTWEYIDEYGSAEEPIISASGEDDEAEMTYAVLSVVNVKDLHNGCLLGVKLRNGLGFEIKTLVPAFSAYKDGDILYQTVSKDFYEVKPTNSRYRKILFSRVACDDIAYIKVGGADHCTMGPYTKFSVEAGECLERIKVQESDLIKISK